MGFLDRYQDRMDRKGEHVGESLTNNTNEVINSRFSSSPTFRVLKVYKYDAFVREMDARVIEVERMGTLREILLRPHDELETGNYVDFDGDIWLLYDRYGAAHSSVKMLAIKTNQVLRWVDQDGVLRDIRCVASATDVGSKSKQSKNEIEWNKFDVRLPIGQLFVSVELNEYTETIGLNHRFIFGQSVYEVTGVDDVTNVQDGYGVVQYTIRLTTKRQGDDFESGLAENLYTVESSSPAPPEEDEGGTLW